jgi:hypothetical protein
LGDIRHAKEMQPHLVHTRTKGWQVDHPVIRKGDLMKRKLAYTFILVGFFVTGGTFGLSAAALDAHPDAPETVPAAATTGGLPPVTASVGIPVTGEPEPVLTEILVFYGLIGVTALFLILALLNFANKTTAAYPDRKTPSSEDIRRH